MLHWNETIQKVSWDWLWQRFISFSLCGQRLSARGAGGWGAPARPRPVPAARLESCGSRQLATRAGLPVPERGTGRGEPLGGCVSGGSSARLRFTVPANFLSSCQAGLVPWSLWCERRRKCEEAQRGGMRDVPDQEDICWMNWTSRSADSMWKGQMCLWLGICLGK